MKKWMYVLGPGIMLAVFLFFYFASRAETEKRLADARAQKAQMEKDAEEKKEIAEKKAREDAEARNIARAAEEVRVAQEKEAKYKAEMARIQADTDKANALVDDYSRQVSELTIELDTLHKQKDSLTREGFDMAKRVQLAQVQRENAELEIQRMVQMIADRADQSFMTKMPPPPPPES